MLCFPNITSETFRRILEVVNINSDTYVLISIPKNINLLNQKQIHWFWELDIFMDCLVKGKQKLFLIWTWHLYIFIKQCRAYTAGERSGQLANRTAAMLDKLGYISNTLALRLQVDSHYERLFQRWTAFEKSNKWAKTSAKLRSREGYFSFTLRTFYIRRNSTFTNISKRLTALDSVC